MAKLGDYAPDEWKGDFVARNLKPGQILYLFCDFTTPSKEKFLIFVCDDKALLFVINSQINPFIQKREELKRSQVCLRAADYDFLKHDSYADCSKVIDEFDLSQITNQIKSDISRIKGKINEQTKAEIIWVVEASTTISPYHKNLIFNALAEEK